MTTPANAPAPTPAAKPRRLTGLLLGTVSSDQRDKTRTVVVQWQFRHPKYGKYLRRSTKYHVHDEKNESHLGDQVEIATCRPMSKTKAYRLVRVVVKAAGVGLAHSEEAPLTAPAPAAPASH